MTEIKTISSSDNFNIEIASHMPHGGHGDTVARGCEI